MPVDVLIVDGSAAIRKILLRVLRHAEIPLGDVFEAGDGLEAIEMLKTKKVGLVLSEIYMPNMDGLQLLSHLRSLEEFQAVPVVMITTEGSHNKVLEAVSLGASGYVRKPFTADQIKSTLTGLI